MEQLEDTGSCPVAKACWLARGHCPGGVGGGVGAGGVGAGGVGGGGDGDGGGGDDEEEDGAGLPLSRAPDTPGCEGGSPPSSLAVPPARTPTTANTAITRQHPIANIVGLTRVFMFFPMSIPPCGRAPVSASHAPGAYKHKMQYSIELSEMVLTRG